MEPDLAVVAARVGGRVRPDVLGVMEMAGGPAMLAAFSKSSTCREAGRLLLPPVRPLNCCALDLQVNKYFRVYGTHWSACIGCIPYSDAASMLPGQCPCCKSKADVLTARQAGDMHDC